MYIISILVNFDHCQKCDMASSSLSSSSM